MEAFARYLRRNIVPAFKSVFYNYKQYMSFFMALIVIQMFYGIITFAADNNDEIEYRRVVEEYDYHILFKDLNYDQYLTMANDHLTTVFKKDQVHDIVRVYERDEYGTYNRKFDVYFKLKGADIQAAYDVFQTRYYEQLAALNPAGLRVSVTPLLTFQQNELANTIAYVFYSLMITVVAVIFLMILYNTRLNHYKFTYGIYMSFGANFTKLVENSFWEMMVVVVLTFIPSVAMSVLVDFLIYYFHGIPFVFHWTGVLKVFIFSTIIAIASVVLPVWALSRKMPQKLIIAEDNSNLVTSPRKSFEFYHIPFPKKYELYSIWRFRSYYVKLVLNAVLFTALFMCSVFYARVYRNELNYEQPQFNISFTDSDYFYDEVMREELNAIEGVTRIEKSIVTDAIFEQAHIRFPKKNARAFQSFVIPADNDELRATSFVQFSPCDAELIEYLERYEYEGDMSLILTDDKYIIVSDSYDNTKKFNFKPGDTLEIAKFKKRNAPIPENASGNELLQAQLRACTFEYTEYTVAAVLKDNPTFGSTPLFMSNAAYTAYTGNKVNYDNINIFIDQELSIPEVNELEEEIRRWSEYYGNVNVSNLHTLSLKRIESDKNYYSNYLAISVLILFISPIIWLFSQVIFYLKREKEFNIITNFGGILAEVRQIFMMDGLFVGSSGVLLAILLNFGGCYGIYKFFNVVVPKFTGTSIRLDFSIPVIAMIVSVVVSISCGLLSSYIPYLNYYKAYKKRTDTAHEFSDDE
ncbi:MAG: hypothetical protein GX628_04010 [Clostridiales bacterium]|nr:hypothetical protein [Clostridiales bacterium]